ncbi:MAG: hypothetical protein FJX77_07305, partial [Armatimonadetes bacterium]|nr:hypothetical protein [Armatimonadota bacterium]
MTNPGPTPAPGPAPAPASRTIRSLGLHLSRLLLWLLGENVVLFWRRHRSLSIAGLLLAASYLAYLACSTQLHTAIAPGGYASLLWAGTSEATAAILSSWLSRGGAKLWLSLSLVADLGMAVASVQCLRCVIIRKDEADSKAVADSTWLVIVSWLVLVASLVQTGAVGCLCWRVGLWGQTGSGTAIPDLGIMPAVLAGAFFLRILCLGVATGYLAWQCRESYFLRMAARSLREFARILNWTAPAGVLTAVLCCVALPFDQFRETLRVTFDPTSPLGPCLWVFGGTLLFSLSVWYLPRALVVTVLEHDPTRSRHERRGMDSTHAEYWGAVLPRVYGLMPFLSLAHNLHLSGSLVTDVYHRASLGRAVGAAVLFCLVMAVLMATLARRLRQVRAAQGGPLNRGFVPWLARCAGGIRETLNHIQQPRMQQAAGSAALRVERVQQKLQADASRLSLLLFTQGIGFLVAALYAGLAGWGYCHGYAYAARNGALGTLLCGLAGISALGIGATWLRVRYGAPVLSPLLLLAAVLSWYGFNDNHQVRVLPASVGAVPAAASPRTNGQPGGLDPFEPAFETWLHQRPGYNRRYVNETPYPVVLVAAEGGGIRAACEAAQTLAYLQDRFPGWEENLSIKDRRFHGFRDHLFAVSGVSGGSVGASVFAALCLREQLLEQIGTQGAMREAQSQVGAGAVTPTPPLAPSDWNNVCKQILREDLLAPAAAALTCGDFLQAFWPRPVPEL